jgi:hypothetical protein
MLAREQNRTVVSAPQNWLQLSSMIEKTGKCYMRIFYLLLI